MRQIERCDADMMAQSCGFDRADEFIRYCEAHSETERALFTYEQIGLVVAMAGEDEKAQEWFLAPDRFISGDAKAVCIAATANLARADNEQKGGA